MAKNQIVTKARTEIEVEGKSAEQVLESLRSRADEFKRSMVEAQKANDKMAFDKAKKSASEYNSAIRQIENSTARVDTVMKNLSGATMNDLLRVQRQITSELRKMTRGTEEYNTKSQQLKKVSAEVRKIRQEMNSLGGAQSSFFSKMTNGFNKYSGMVLGIVGTLTGLGLTFRKLAADADEYNQRVANLGALTGLAGDDLNWLSDKAKELSTSMTEDGVRITKSAGDIVDAFTIMAGKKPELLQNKEALTAITTEALKLAEAAQMDTKVAVESLANVMNQFGAEADEATRYINTLAAGSRHGAATVDKIADSIIKFGPAAASANVSVEESVALVEALADKGIEGEIAGTALRNVLLKLQTGADQFNPKVVGMQQALENLNDANLSAGELLDMFGRNAYSAAQVLISTKDHYAELTEAVTDTNTATEQAIINTETEKAKREQAINAFKLMAMELGQKLSPILRHVTVTTGTFIRMISQLVSWMGRHRKTIVVVTSAIVAYTAAIKAQEMWTKITATATRIADAAMKGFNATLKASGIGLIIAGITAAATALGLFGKKAKDAADAVDELTEAELRYQTIKEGHRSIEERMKIFGTLTKRQVEVLKENIEKHLDLEEDFTSDLLSTLRKRIDNDTEIHRLTKQINDTQLDYRKAFYRNQIKHRERELASDLAKEKDQQNERLDNLKKYLKRVELQLTLFEEEEKKQAAKSYEDLANAQKEYYDRLVLQTHRHYLQGRIDKEERDHQLLMLEVAHLEAMLALQRQYGELTYDTELKLTQQRIRLMEQMQEKERKWREEQDKWNEQYLKDSEKEFDDFLKEIQAQTNAEIDEAKRLAEERKRIREQEYNDYVQKMEQFRSIAGSLGADLGNLLSTMANDAEMTSEQIAREMLRIALDGLHAVVQVAMAEVWVKAIAKGPAAIAKAVVQTAAIEAVFAGVKAALTTQQRFAGKYDVIGEDDGRTYRNVPYKGDMRTGIYSTPTLVAERGPELIVDAGTLRNLHFNFPDVLPKIQASKVRQMAEGNVEQFDDGFNWDADSLRKQRAIPLVGLEIVLHKLISAVDHLMENGVQAKMQYHEFRKSDDKVKGIEQSTSRSS